MIKLRKSKDGQFYFVVCSPKNGKVLATSEMYKRKTDAARGADRMLDAACAAICSSLPVPIQDETKHSS